LKRVRIGCHHGGGIRRRTHVAIGHRVEPRFDDKVVEFAAHLVFQRIGAL
jgi:hypothetical protein